MADKEHLKALRENCAYIDRMRRVGTRRKQKHRKNAWLKAYRKERKTNSVGRVRYQDYIKSPEWFRKRREALVYYKYTCDLCGDRRRLQVHHKTYARLGMELMKDLQVLCVDCHKDVHESCLSGLIDDTTEQFLDDL